MPPRSRAPFPTPNSQYMHPMMTRGGHPMMNRMGGGMRPSRGPQRGGGGGLLSKLLGKGGGGSSQGANPFTSFPARGANRAAAGAGGSGGILKTLTDPNALNGLLTNTQKVLNTAGQIGPVIQQYGPLVRNLPSLWKLYKGFKDMPSDSDESPSESDEGSLEFDESPSIIEETSTKSKKRKAKKSEDPTDTFPPERKKNTGQSVPKLYI